MTVRGAAAAVLALTLASTGAGGCVSDVAIGVDRVAGAGSGGAAAGTGGGAQAGSAGSAPLGGFAGDVARGGSAGESGGPTTDCVEALCGSKLYACGDCDDNDRDGAVDSADSECLGPCDNTEDSYYPDIEGQNGGGQCRQDCYFDRGAGANDQCFSSFRCDPQSVDPSYPPSGDADCAYDPATNIPGTNASCEDLAETQSDTCAAGCGPLVPNGCDCFGCCELPAQSGNYVWIGSTDSGTGTCDEDSVDDPSACHPCTPVRSCLNPCEECELCAGRLTPGDDCATGGTEQCPPGGIPCGLPGQALCFPGQYCVTGCCQVEPR